jgi:GLPGLI family protein
MNKILFLSLTFLIASASFSQRNYTVVYRSTYLDADTINPLKMYAAFHLVVQDTFAFCYYPESLRKFQHDSTKLGAAYFPKGAYFNSKENIVINQEGFYEKPKSQYLRVRKTNLGNWKILPGEKNILGYKCKKATAVIDGSKLTVWFTEELPCNYGPYSMTSLPGTILEQLRNDNGLLSMAIGVASSNREIVEPNFCKRIGYKSKSK